MSEVVTLRIGSPGRGYVLYSSCGSTHYTSHTPASYLCVTLLPIVLRCHIEASLVIKQACPQICCGALSLLWLLQLRMFTASGLLSWITGAKAEGEPS